MRVLAPSSARSIALTVPSFLGEVAMLNDGWVSLAWEWEAGVPGAEPRIETETATSPAANAAGPNKLLSRALIPVHAEGQVTSQNVKERPLGVECDPSKAEVCVGLSGFAWPSTGMVRRALAEAARRKALLGRCDLLLPKPPLRGWSRLAALPESLMLRRTPLEGRKYEFRWL